MLLTKLPNMLQNTLRTGFHLVAIFALLFSLPSMADQHGSKDKNIPEPPPMATDADESQQIEADVTIIRKKYHTIEEYRVNGKLHMVRITPTKGKPYYLLYPKNGGSPVRRDLDDIQTPYWKLFEW